MANRPCRGCGRGIPSRQRPSVPAHVCGLDRKLGNQQNGFMKTTVELPDALVKQVKVRALQEGRKLKDAVADLLQRGLAMSDDRDDSAAPALTTDRQTGLPLIQCKRTATAGNELTPERVAKILLLQDTEWHHAAGR
jgi:plasmid stability protein